MIAVFGFSLVLIDSDQAYQMIIWNSMIVPKMFIVFNLIVFLEDIVGLLVRIKIDVNKKVKKLVHIVEDIRSPKNKIESIDIQQLVSFIFKYEKFGNVEFQETFGKNNAKYQKIGELLERKGILKRGDKNARILNSDMTMGGVIDLLTAPIIQKDGESSYLYNE